MIQLIINAFIDGLCLVSPAFMFYAVSIFVYCTFFSTNGWSTQEWLFGAFLVGAISTKVIYLFIRYFYKGEPLVSTKISKNLIWVYTTTIVISVITLYLGSTYLISSDKVIENLPYIFFVIPFCIILISRFVIKWPPFYLKSEAFIIPAITLLFAIIYIEIQTRGDNKLIIVSSFWRYVGKNDIYRFRYLIIFTLTLILTAVLNLFNISVQRSGAFNKFLNKRRSLLFFIFVFISFLTFIALKKRVSFGSDSYDIVNASVSGNIYYKYPLAFIIPHFNYLLFSDLFDVYTSFCILSFVAGFVIFIQLFRIWELLWPKDILRRLCGRMLTMIPYGTAQFYFCFDGRKVIELAFFTSLIYYTLLVMKRNRGFFLIGVLAAFTFGSHVLQILSVPAVALACYLASGEEKWSKKIFHTVQYFAGFILGYIIIYGYVGNLRFIYDIFFNRKCALVQEEITNGFCSLNKIFSSHLDHFRKIADNINSYGPVGFLLIIAMWLMPSKKHFLGNKNIAIFLGTLALSCLLWVPWKNYFNLWHTFDQFVSPFVILNIFGVYIWLASSKNIKEFVFTVALLFTIFGIYSSSIIVFMHNHRFNFNYSFKNKHQSIIQHNWKLVDEVDFGCFYSEKKHKFKIQGIESNWKDFLYYPGTSIASHSWNCPYLLGERYKFPVIFEYENHEIVADEGRLCKEYIELELAVKPRVNNVILWRTIVVEDVKRVPMDISKEIKYLPTIEVIVDNKKLGLWEMKNPLKLIPERMLNDYDWMSLPDHHLHPYKHWQEFRLELPYSFLTKENIRVKMVSNKGIIMQMYYMWVFAENES